MHHYVYKSTAGTVNKTFLHHVSTFDSNVGLDGLCRPPPLGTDVARQTSARQTSALTYKHILGLLPELCFWSFKYYIIVNCTAKITDHAACLHMTRCVAIIN